MLFVVIWDDFYTCTENPSLFSYVLQSFTLLSLGEVWSMTVLVNGHASCNSTSWSCANGWPSSVNTFISCRLTAAVVEQKTSSGMNQMKEQIIPSSPRMTCSSDPESVFASLASLKALSPKCSTGQSVRASVRVCVFSGYPVLIQLFFNHCRRWVGNRRTDNKHKLKLDLREWWMSALNVQYISAELKRRDTGCSFPFLPPLPPSPHAVVFYLCVFPHVSQSEASGRLGTYLT